MSFNMDDYVDVAERLSLFYERHPQGSLQGVGEFVREGDKIVGYLYRAAAYRTPDDECPGIGTAFEPVPGKTPYTRDSEVMNAETSAWGRAIVACGFPTKKIASADEVRARSAGAAPSATRPASEPEPNEGGAGGGAPAASPAEAMVGKAMEAQNAKEHPSGPPQDDGKPENVILTFGKHKSWRVGDVPRAYLEWVAANFEAKSAEHRREVAAVNMYLGKPDPFGSTNPDDDIPF